MPFDTQDVLRQAGYQEGDFLPLERQIKNNRITVTSQTFTGLFNSRTSEIYFDPKQTDLNYHIAVSFNVATVSADGFDLRIKDNQSNTTYLTETFDTGGYISMRSTSLIDISDEIANNSSVAIRGIWKSNDGNKNRVIDPAVRFGIVL